MAARRASAAALVACAGGVILYHAGKRYFFRLDQTGEEEGDDSKVKIYITRLATSSWRDTVSEP